MSNRVSRLALKSTVAITAIVVGSIALTGCTTLGSRAFGDPTTTGSIGSTGASNLSQPMPPSLNSAPTRVAASRFIPPANVNGGGMGGFSQPAFNQPMPIAPLNQQPLSSVSSENLPALTPSSSLGTQQAMPAPQTIAPVTVGPQTAALAPLPQTAAPNLAVVPSNAYVHVIESGESLYTIARRYDVTAQAIVSANGLASPDKIFVGQKVVIPGRADLLAAKGKPIADAATQAPLPLPNTAQQVTTTAAITDPNLLKPKSDATPESKAPVQVASVQTKPNPAPMQEPQMSGADKFRWPVSGKVITSFSASKGTGINIETPEGTAIRAAENGTVIYVGSGVEGYGNLILIRHANGYVSAYAHLKSMSVAKGAVVNRGDNIGAAGMTGSVSKPQLHFELRKGATPVDPVPLLAS